MVVAAWNGYRLRTPATLSPVEQAADLRAEAAVLVREIEAYRDLQGRLPEPAAIAYLMDQGLSYRVVDPVVGRYEVTRTAGGVSVTYDGSLPVVLWVLLGETS